MNISPAVENYLETILIISKKQKEIHAADICAFLNYSRPTVSVVLKQLKESGLVTVDGDNHVTLTEKGLTIAETIYERHNIIASMLMALGVDEQTAYEDACKLEHQISAKSFACIKAYYKEHFAGR